MKRLLLTLLVFAMMSLPALATERIALVIGNSDYRVDPLSNPVNDARDMAKVLRELGFQVTLKVNANQMTMESAIQAFGNKLHQKAVGLFYFSGHGMQYRSENYLIPINSIRNMSAADHLRYKAVPAGYVLGVMRTAGNRLNIVILDACRDNPFKGIFGLKGYGHRKGLAEMNSISGSIIAYAARPGRPALEDKKHRNSYYTKHLLRFIKQNGLTLTELFSRVSWAVAQDTNGEQEPWTSFLSLPRFCLAGNCQMQGPQPVVDHIAREVAKLLKTCQFRFDNNWLTTGGSGTAFACYKEVLKFDPNNLEASRGLVNIENRYVTWAESALKKGNKSKARQYLARLRLVNPESPELAVLESQLESMSTPTTMTPSQPVISSTAKISIPTRVWKTIKAHKGGWYGSICLGSCLSFSPDGRFLLSGSWDKRFKLFNINTGKLMRTFKGHSSRVLSVAYSPDGKMALSASNDRSAKLWELSTGQLIRTFNFGSIEQAAFSPDGQKALLGGVQGIQLWELATGKPIRTFEGYSSNRYIIDRDSLTFSPDGQKALVGGNDPTIRLWNIPTGQLIRTFKGHSSRVQSVVFSPDRQKALSGSTDNTIKLWDLSTGQVIHTFYGHSSFVHSVAFSPNGHFVASGSEDKTIKLWEVSSGKLIRTLKEHKSSVMSVTFSLDGTLASGDYGGVIKLWW